MRRTRRTAVAIGVVAALAVSSQAATVATADDCVDGSADDELAAYCEAFDVTASEALEQLELQPEIDDAIAEVQELAGDRLVLAATERADFSGVQVVVTDGAPLPELETYLDGLAFDADLDYRDVLSAAAGDAVTDELVDDGIAAMPDVDGMYYDVTTGAVVVDYSGDGDESLFDDLAATVEEAGSTLEVRISEGEGGDARVGGLDSIYTSTWCTIGFTILASDGTTRTTTAGHCPDSPWRYEAASGSHSNPIAMTGERRTARADIQWGTTGMAPLPQIVTSTMSTRVTVTSVVDRADSLGDLVCHRGSTTGYSCGTVTSINYRPTWDGACHGVTCAAEWVQVTGPQLACYGGDSGGPVFAGGAAYGFLKGAMYTGTGRGECDWLVYMPQDALSEIGASASIALG